MLINWSSHSSIIDVNKSFWIANKSWRTAGASIGATVFPIYMNDLPEGLNSEFKLCADDTSLFSIANCVNTSASTLNSDLLKMQDWAHKWKTSFNPDRTKQAQEIFFSRKKNTTTHPPVFFSNSEIKLSSDQKHVGFTLNSKLWFNEHINNKTYQANKGVGFLQNLQTVLPRNSSLTI